MRLLQPQIARKHGTAPDDHLSLTLGLLLRKFHIDEKFFLTLRIRARYVVANIAGSRFRAFRTIPAA
jgi:hypothetical protein